MHNFWGGKRFDEFVTGYVCNVYLLRVARCHVYLRGCICGTYLLQLLSLLCVCISPFSSTFVSYFNFANNFRSLSRSLPLFSLSICVIFDFNQWKAIHALCMHARVSCKTVMRIRLRISCKGEFSAWCLVHRLISEARLNDSIIELICW